MSTLSCRTTRKTMSRHNAKRALARIGDELNVIIRHSPMTDVYTTETARVAANYSLMVLLEKVEALYAKDH